MNHVKNFAGAIVVLAMAFALAGCQQVVAPTDTVPGLQEVGTRMVLPVPTTGAVYSVEELKRLEAERLAERDRILGARALRQLVNGTHTFTRSATVSRDFAGRVIFDNTHARAVIQTGGVSFSPSFEFLARIEGGLLREARATVGGTVSCTAVVRVTMKNLTTNVSGDVSVNFFTKSWTAFTLVKGVVPVWVTFAFDINPGVCYVGRSAAWLQRGISVSSTVTVGARWLRGPGWENISSHTGPTFTQTPLTFHASASMRMSPRLDLSLSARLYDLIGPVMTVTPSLSVVMTLSPTERVISSSVRLRGVIYFDLAGLNENTIWHRQLFNASHQFPNVNF